MKSVNLKSFVKIRSGGNCKEGRKVVVGNILVIYVTEGRSVNMLISDYLNGLPPLESIQSCTYGCSEYICTLCSMSAAMELKDF